MPFASKCSLPVSAAAVAGKAYFLPTVGSSSAAQAIQVYDFASASWEAAGIPIPASTGISDHLDGAFLSATADETGAPWLVVAGGKTSAGRPTGMMWSYSVAKANWTRAPDLNPPTWDLCAVGCGGAAFLVTGGVEGSAAEKPANRQIVRLNLTANTLEANNMKKERDGAGCACNEAAARTFWAGGATTVGKQITTDTVEVWGATPFHRRGEPVWKLPAARKYAVGTSCGGFVAFAGGKMGDTLFGDVTVYNATDNSPAGITRTYPLPAAVYSPAVTCVDDRVILVAGGPTDHAGDTCSTTVVSIDVTALPAAGSKLDVVPFALQSGSARVGGVASGKTAVFFNGAGADVLTLAD